MSNDNNASAITQKVWAMCGVLYDDGVSYGDYLEQITYLIFLKMASEYAKTPYDRNLGIPETYTWERLENLAGAELEKQYKATLENLAGMGGILGRIFQGAQNKISEAAKLKKIVNMIGSVNWVSMSSDVKGDIYEGLLEKNASDTKSGAGQYFTPRPLIRAMVECLHLEPKKTIVDPACGTGGFFLAAYNYLTDTSKMQLDRSELKFLQNKTFRGWEIVSNTYRLCLMNMFLHNIGTIDGDPLITRNDALLSDPGERFDYVLTNPPFGKKSSMTFTNEEGNEETEDLVYNRQDFWATSSNKQLNFVQHIHTLLKTEGKAAVVVPDNVLFEGGAGEIVRKKLLETTDFHTILRLPTGVFYKQGVKANVIFFDNKSASKNPWTKEVWVYDFRTNKRFTLKQNPLQYEDLQDFITCYKPEDRHKRRQTWSETNPEGRWRKFTYNEIITRDKTSLDIFWVKDNSLTDLDNLPEPEELAAEIMGNLKEAMERFGRVVG
ncbi:MAG: type I restriction-modification system subunit M [Spirochaetaceae bacterium]|jgi:type I restriction enzyme M protein|nr:type I restriction-modification system subunit M [Spirochaetaceae bacterium]